MMTDIHGALPSPLATIGEEAVQGRPGQRGRPGLGAAAGQGSAAARAGLTAGGHGLGRGLAAMKAGRDRGRTRRRPPGVFLRPRSGLGLGPVGRAWHGRARRARAGRARASAAQWWEQSGRGWARWWAARRWVRMAQVARQSII